MLIFQAENDVGHWGSLLLLRAGRNQRRTSL